MDEVIAASKVTRAVVMILFLFHETFVAGTVYLSHLCNYTITLACIFEHMQLQNPTRHGSLSSKTAYAAIALSSICCSYKIAPS
jgi:hypothetical protein